MLDNLPRSVHYTVLVLSRKYLDVPMLDMRRSKNYLEFCDIVINTDDIQTWQKAILQFYGGESVLTKNMTSGTKLIISRGTKPFVTVTLYTRANKLLIQPADNQERHLLAMLKDIPAISQLRVTIDDADLANMTLPDADLANMTLPDADVANMTLSDADLANMTLPESSRGHSAINCEVKRPDTPEESDEQNLLLKSTAVPLASIVNPTSPVLAPPKFTVELRPTPGDADDTVREALLIYGDASVSQSLKSSGVSPTVSPPETKTPTGKGRKIKTVSSTKCSTKHKCFTFKKRKSTGQCDKAPEGHISLLVPRPPMPLGSDYHKKQFIVNEVLCYIQNKMDTEAKEVIVNLASQFFSYEEIVAAKKLLYEMAPVTRRRLIIHRGDDKTKQEVADIYYHFHSVELNDIPLFLALDIGRLPPLTSNSNDMTTILQNIESMQTHIKTLTEAQKTMSEVMASHICREQLSNTDKTENTIGPIEGSGRSQGATSEEIHASQESSTTLESDDLESSLSQHSSISSDNASDDEVNEDSGAQGAPVLKVAKTSQAASAYPKIKTRIFSSNKNSGPRSTNIRKQPAAPTGGTYLSSNLVSDRSIPQNRQVSPDSHQGRQLNQNHKPQSAKDNVVQGTGTAPGLRAINKQRQTVSTDAGNRTCTGIFITRLRPHTTANDVETYLRHETGISVKAEKLPTRYNSYSSFYIRCGDPQRATLLDGRVWPTGSLVKPYYT